MEECHCSRRTVLSGVVGGVFTCITGSSLVKANPTLNHTGPPDLKGEWNELTIDGYPLIVTYVDGYEEDAEWIKEMAKTGYDTTQEAWAYDLDGPVYFRLIPGEHWPRSHDSMMYNDSDRSAYMVAPKDYDGGRVGMSDDIIETYYRHGVIHELLHAPQWDLVFGDGVGVQFPDWWIEGFVEGLTVYHSTDDIYEQYHTREDAAEFQRHIRNNHGYLMMMFTDIYRGSMQVFRYLFDDYGIEDVAHVHKKNADNFIDAMEIGLGITPVEMERGWLEYASEEFGGEYSDEITKDPSVSSSVASATVGAAVGGGTVYGAGRVSDSDDLISSETLDDDEPSVDTEREDTD